MQSIEEIESLLMEHKNTLDTQAAWMEIGGQVKPALIMERPLFSPPMKIAFEKTMVEDGQAAANTNALFEQFYVNLDELRNNIKQLLRIQPQVSLSNLLQQHPPTKGMAEILG